MKLFGICILTHKRLKIMQRSSKRDAYQRVYAWAKSNHDLAYGSTGWYAKSKMEGHDKYLESLNNFKRSAYMKKKIK